MRERTTIPILDNLSKDFLSAEYEIALARALAMPECPVVPFFGAFLRELRDAIAYETKVNTRKNFSTEYHILCIFI